jgi:hypothetical protein
MKGVENRKSRQFIQQELHENFSEKNMTLWTENPVFFFEKKNPVESVSEKLFRKSVINTQSKFKNMENHNKKLLMRKSWGRNINNPFFILIVSCCWQFVKYRFDLVVNLMWMHEGRTPTHFPHSLVFLLYLKPRKLNNCPFLKITTGRKC